jgi:hypothetical protein
VLFSEHKFESAWTTKSKLKKSNQKYLCFCLVRYKSSVECQSKRVNYCTLRHSRWNLRWSKLLVLKYQDCRTSAWFERDICGTAFGRVVLWTGALVGRCTPTGSLPATLIGYTRLFKKSAYKLVALAA